jgi:hypothetical protein
VEWPLGLSWQSPSVALFQQNRRHVLIRYGSQRRPPTNTNDNDKSWQWVAHRTKINSSDPPLTAVRTAYPTPPFLPFLHPPIELASLRPRGRLDLDGWVHFSAVCFGQVLQLAVGQLCRPDVQDGGVWTRPGKSCRVGGKPIHSRTRQPHDSIESSLADGAHAEVRTRPRRPTLHQRRHPGGREIDRSGRLVRNDQTVLSRLTAVLEAPDPDFAIAP